jgi:CheY-like chemotaxis protein
MHLAKAHRFVMVDDNEDDRILFGVTMRHAHIDAATDYLTTGPDAVAYVQGCLAGVRAWPAVLILDIQMPVIDGFGVLKWMHANRVTQHTVVVMMSNSRLPQDIQRAFALGAHSYICKSGDASGLIELVRTASSFASPSEAAAQVGRVSPDASSWTERFGPPAG